ncbi:Catabolite control protein [Serratia quinivorans]|jgi:LacI family transcriptional regulator of maltose regulon|uniref:Catabolite control protein n=2 Tax=Serratia TaxID=613 RepID=A0A2X2HDH2_9GAMM|nr:Catabolite control protein [Serratia quinivorans]CAI1659564.1 Catabolite control protein [Serratia quinivorans]SPZ65113.1 Catabolite control protein [Serratia quinivorans]SUI92316.1 Catabolite control protein [Serratia quinivorans]VEI69181.1 Catabolite control protein [Serratia quinivorans]
MPRIGLAEVMTIKKITITDVAQQAGVSVTTVSLVLSGKGRISPTTVARVNQAIERLGYVRNRQAATLRGGESGVIGLILRDICEPFYAEMTAGLSEVLEAHGKVLFLTQSGRDGKGLMRCFDTLLEHGIDGMVLAGGVRSAEGLKEKAAEQGVPLVCAARSNGLEGVDVVRPDNMQAAKMATEFLIKRGHSQIAYLGGQSSSLTRAERLGGFCATLVQYGLPFRSDWIVECDCHQRAAAEAAENLLRQHPNISALVCHKASVALGAYFGIVRSGRSIGSEGVDTYYGQQVALIGFGDVPEAELTEPPLTLVSSSAREVGRSAASRLLQRIADADLAPQNVILPPLLIKRGSA